MKPVIYYRIASVLLLLFAALHTFGFRQVAEQPRSTAHNLGNRAEFALTCCTRKHMLLQNINVGSAQTAKNIPLRELHLANSRSVETHIIDRIPLDILRVAQRDCMGTRLAHYQLSRKLDTSYNSAHTP